MQLGTKPKVKKVRVQISELEGSKPIRGRSSSFVVFELSFEEVAQRIQAAIEKALEK